MKHIALLWIMILIVAVGPRILLLNHPVIGIGLCTTLGIYLILNNRQQS